MNRKQNKRKRLAWAKKYKDWTAEDWKKVLWTDESKFEVFGNKRRSYVRRGVGERMSPNCIRPTVKHGGGSVMIWGCFGGNSVGDLIKIDTIMDKKLYHKILQFNAFPSGKKIIGRNFVFQQDNDPKHTSKYCKDYIIKKEQRRELQFMDWPAQSPDCNPIELLWDHLDMKIRETHITSAKHLWTVLNDSWKMISSETLLKLQERMPRVCAAVIKAKGGYFEESKI